MSHPGQQHGFFFFNVHSVNGQIFLDVWRPQREHETVSYPLRPKQAREVAAMLERFAGVKLGNRATHQHPLPPSSDENMAINALQDQMSKMETDLSNALERLAKLEPDREVDWWDVVVSALRRQAP